MKNKKILVFGITENPGGVENFLMNYYRNIDRKKFQFDFLCNTETVAYEEEILKLGGKVYRITARNKNRKKFNKDLDNFFKDHSKKYSALWVNVCSLANIDYLKYAKKYGIKCRIIHSHNSMNMDGKLRGLLHRFNKFFVKKYATDFWACSDIAGKWFYNKKILSCNKYKIINNAIDIEKFKFNEKIRQEYRKKLNLEDKIVFSNIGRLHFQKNQKFAIKIFYELSKEIDNCVLLLVGQGEDEEKLKKQVKDLNLTDKVLFLGVRKDVEKLMQAIDILLFPSLFEGLGVVLIEAQAAGLLIFASKEINSAMINVDNPKLIFKSLKEEPKLWKNEIISNLHKLDIRKDEVKKIKKEGFDILIEVKKIEEFFQNIE